MENDNDAEMGTNVGVVEGQFVSVYFVRWVYLFRYPTAHSSPRKLTSLILALSDVKAIIVLGRYATCLVTYYYVVT